MKTQIVSYIKVSFFCPVHIHIHINLVNFSRFKQQNDSRTQSFYENPKAVITENMKLVSRFLQSSEFFLI